MDTMISVQDLLQALASRDIKLWVEDGRLRVNAPQGALTPDLKQALSDNKASLLKTLAADAAGGQKASGIRPWPRDQKIPLTQGQERIWSLARLDPASSTYNVPTVFRLKGKLNSKALEAALDAVQQRHEALRTVFVGAELDTVHQVVRPYTPFVLPRVDLSRDLGKLDPKRGKAAIQKVMEAEVRRPFDLANGPLWRAVLFRLGAGMHILCITMHHIIFDGVSKAIFLSELGQSYDAITAGESRDEAPLPVQFADFAGWQRESLTPAQLERQLGHWSTTLSGEVPSLATPNQKRRQSRKGPAGSLQFSFPAGFSKRIDTLLQQEKASPFVFFQAVFNLLLNRYTGQSDLLVCSPMASRSDADVERLIGYFNNIVVLRTTLSSEASFRELMAQTRKNVIEAFDNQFVPLQRIAQLPGLVRTQMTRAMLSFQDSFSGSLRMAGLEARPVNVRKGVADFDLALYIEKEGERIAGVLDYNADIFQGVAIKRLLQRYGHLIDQVLKNPDSRISDFPEFGRKRKDVETLLNDHPKIDAAVVVPDQRTGQTYAYLVLNEHDVPDLEDIRAYMGKSLPDYRVPVAFIPVDQFPLLGDGSVDFSALPQPGLGRSHLSTEYAAPATELEKALAEIWKKVLWLDYEVGVNDNFRELGGHSLLSVQLVVEIESKLGRKVPARALAELNSVKDLARQMESGESELAAGDEVIKGNLPAEIYHGLRSHTASWVGARTTPESVIVGLNVEGTRVPLFWCLQRYQELTQLAKYLGPEQPVYGMRSGNRVMIKTQDNINLLASFYVSEIQEIQPKGPYRIGGNCQAAQIAFQIAAQLRRLGEQVEILFLHEKFISFPYDSPVLLTFGKDSVYNPKNYYKTPQFGWRKYYSGPLVSQEVLGGHGQFFREPNVQDLVGTLQRYLDHADRQSPVSMIAMADTPRQVLASDAYRAEISVNTDTISRGDAGFRIPVSVVNRSAVRWSRTAISGLYLSGRWVDGKGNHQQCWEIYESLNEDLEPGKGIAFDLNVRLPSSAGAWALEIDMIDEGVARFGEYGSESCVVSLNMG